MADLKISQLTGATTPLAGTEVVPLVQSGTTKKVAVSDLTAGRAVSMASVNVSSSAANSAVAGIFNNDTADGNGVYVKAGGANSGKYNIVLQNAASQDLLAVYADGTVQTGIGNIKINTAAKGVNFTANTPAAGMTSQLLNWYEEGTWTPNQGAGLTVVGAFSSAGVYTRVGRQVTVTGRVTGATSVDTSTSGIVCTNLPFTVGTNSNSVGAMTNTATNNTYVYVNPSTATMYSSTAAGASGSLYFTVTYSI